LAESRAGDRAFGLQLWRLGETGPEGLGLYCGADGLLLAGTPLIERQGASYRVRPPGEVERLLSCAYGAAFDSAPVMRGLAQVASALAMDNLAWRRSRRCSYGFPIFPARSPGRL
jgi:hypothetical protein